VHLRDMTKMRWLRLGNTQVTDAGLEHLRGLSELRTLYLRDTQVTGEGVAELRKALPQLR